MFERFTESSRRVVVLAQEESRTLGHHHIGTEHLLLGLLHEQSGIPARVLGTAGVTLETARAEVTAIVGPGSEPTAAGHIPFTPRAKRVLELSLREALALKQDSIGTEHVLLALLREQDGVGARVLARLIGSLPALRRWVLKEATGAPPGAAAERERRESWAGDWRTAQAFAREARGLPQTIVDFRQLLAPVDRRLAGIERHLGIAADERPAAGFRGLLASIDRHVANIERHLGIAPGEATGPPPGTAGEPGGATGEPGETEEEAGDPPTAAG